MKTNLLNCSLFGVALAVSAAAKFQACAADFVAEPAKRVPVVYDVDVVVAGGGVSGIFAAIAAARNGAETVLIERFSSVGGTSGPGMITGGGKQKPGDSAVKTPFAGQRGSKKGEYFNVWVYPEIAGIPKEFAQKLELLVTSDNDLEESSAIAYLATKMLKEAGVHLLLSTYVTDPLLEGNTVKGVFVENKSGRQAVKAKIVIDATGEADVARRSGASILYPEEDYYKVDSHAPIGMGGRAYIGGIDWRRYDAAIQRKEQTKPDLSPRKIGEHGVLRVSSFDKMQESEAIARISVPVAVRPDHPKVSDGLAFPVQLDPGNVLHMSQIESELRLYVFEFVQQARKQVPGCENCYLLEIAPYVGARGGPRIEGEYTLTMDDCKAGRKFEDVIYLFGELRALRYTCIEDGKCVWPDVPYRVMVPKKIDGLLAVGRSASGTPDTLLRNRTAVQHMGQVGGIAAAMAAKQGISPRKVNVKELQRKLLQAGFYLGDEARLKELGLADRK